MEKSVLLQSRVEGEGEPLVVLHGLLGSSANWSWQMRKLATLRETHALDLRNHGASPWTEEMDYDVMVADVMAYASRFGWKTMDVIGHSLGGKVAMWLALTQPQIVRKLIVVDMGAGVIRSENDKVLQVLWDIEQSRPTMRQAVEMALRDKRMDEAMIPFFTHGLKTRADGTLGWKANLATLLRAYPTMRRGFESDRTFLGSTLFLCGELSDYVRKTDEAEIRHYFPSAEFEVIEGSGHLPHIEKPSTFFERVAAFLHR